MGQKRNQKGEKENYLETNENGNTPYQNLRDNKYSSEESVQQTDAYIKKKKEERSQVSRTLYQKEPEKEEQSKGRKQQKSEQK